MPDSAWIAYAAYNAAEPKRRATGSALVEDGQFTAEADISDWPAGKIVIDTNFLMLIPGRVQPTLWAKRRMDDRR